MKAIIMAFGADGDDVCSRVQGVLKEEKAELVRSGEEHIGGRPCFAAIAEFQAEASNFKSVQTKLKAEGERLGIEIKVLRPDMFLAVHRIVPTALEPIT